MASCAHNVLASLGSPSKQGAPRTHICSPTFRRERSTTATAALPFGFGAFGFGNQANAGAAGAPGSPAPDSRGHRLPEGFESSGSAVSGPAITAASASVHSPGSPHSATGGAPAASGGARRRLSLPPLAAAASSAMAAAPAAPFFGRDSDRDKLLSDQHRVAGEGGSTHRGLMGIVLGSGTCTASALQSKQQLHELLAEVDLRGLLPGLSLGPDTSDQAALLPHSARGAAARQPHSPHTSTSSHHRGVDLLREHRPSADLAQRRQRLLEALHSSLAAAPLGHTGVAVPLQGMLVGGSGGSGCGHWRRSELLAGTVLPRVVDFLTDELALAVPAAGGPGAAAVSAGLLPMRGITSSTAMALECLCTLFSEELPELNAAAHASHNAASCDSWRAAVTTVVAVLAAARLPAATAWGAEQSYWIPSVPSPAPVSASQSASSAVDWGLLAGLASDSRVSSATAPAGLGDAGADCTADAAGWSPDVSAAFFAASALVRLARNPQLAAAAVEGGAVEAVVRLMGSRPAMLAQMAVFAAYKLLRGPAAAPGAQPSSPRGSPSLVGSDGSAGAVESGVGSASAAASGGREAALLAMAQAGGLGALCSCLRDLPDRPSRDMASSLMLDMALVPQVPAVVARLSQVLPLVSVLGDRRAEAATRMYALLVLARLANHSPECQMDAVREGAIGPLLALVRRGSEEEQTHACRLLAILAQAVPTHGRFKELGVVQSVLPLLRGSRAHAPHGPLRVGASGGGSPSSSHVGGSQGSVHTPLVSEHAASVVAVLAQNPDMHFHVVGVGAVPALVPLLSAGSDKARTYVLAALMLLCEGEERHAAVVVRAGALPTLVTLAGGASAQESADGGSGSSHSASSRRATHAQEFSAAVLCCMSRYVDMQEELLAHAAVPALVSCLAAGGVDAAVHAAEALVHLAGGEAVCKRMVSSEPAAAAMVVMLLGADKPSARYWGLQLLRVISTDDTALGLLVGLSREQASRYGSPSGCGSGMAELRPGAGTGSRSGGLTLRGGQLPFPWSGIEDAMPMGPPAPGSLVFGSPLLYGGQQPGDAAANAEAQRLLAGPLSVLLGPFASGSSTSSSAVSWAETGSAQAAASNADASNVAPMSEPAGPGSAGSGVPLPPALAVLEPVPSPPAGVKVVEALVRLLSLKDGGSSWQQGRCRVLAAWLLARMCDHPPLAPLVLASGAVRELAGMLAEEQQRAAALAAAAAAAAVEAAAAGELPESKSGELTIPLLPGEGDGLGLSESNGSIFHRGGMEMADGGAGGSMGLVDAGGPGMNARRARFDSNAAAASEAALLAVCRSLGWQGRQAVMGELVVRQWLGQSLRLSGF